jgi:hypothetical protein
MTESTESEARVVNLALNFTGLTSGGCDRSTNPAKPQDTDTRRWAIDTVLRGRAMLQDATSIRNLMVAADRLYAYVTTGAHPEDLA